MDLSPEEFMMRVPTEESRANMRITVRLCRLRQTTCARLWLEW
jgi:hypothetical protein